jgi:hypothetical protein
MFFGAALVALPEVLRLLPFLTGENIASFPGAPPLTAAFHLAFPVSIFGPALLASAALALGRKWRRVTLELSAREIGLLGLALVFITVLALTAFSLSTRGNLLFLRYGLAVYPGWFLVLPCLPLDR